MPIHFEDRQAKYPNRWTMTKSDGTSEVVTLIRNDEPIVDGTPMNAETLNSLSDVAGADLARALAESARMEAQTAASNAASSAASATTSETNSATSEAAAKASAESAAASAELAGTRASTDKTLSIEGAPADAKQTGEELAKKLNLSGGTMTGRLDIALSSGDYPILSTKKSGNNAFRLKSTETGADIIIGIGGQDSNKQGIWDVKNKKWLIYNKTDTGETFIDGVSVGLLAYPVGSLYMSTDATSPAELFGGTWEQIAQGRALMGASTTHPAGSTAEAGLPNIVGKASVMCYMSGADYTNKKRVNGFLTAELLNNTAADVSHPSNGNQMWLNTYVTWDASTYSSIYGNSTTVQPPAYFTNIWRRIE